VSNTAYPANINPVVDGQAVNAASDSVPINQLTLRTDSLREKVDNGLYGSALFAYDVPVESSAAVGMPVYLDDDGVWRKALAGTEIVDDVEQVLRSTWVCGIVFYKHNSTLADVLTGGYAQILGSAMDDICDETLEPGPFFLTADSGSPGFITQTQPAVGIQVGYLTDTGGDGNRYILIAPQPHGLLQSHHHYKFDLAMVVSVDAEDAGWVAVPSGLATTLWPGVSFPTDTRFGYNYAADGNMDGLFPSGAMASYDIRRNGVGLRMNGSAPECVVNSDGVWWTCADADPEAGADVEQPGGCTVPDQIEFWVTQMTGDLNQVYVRSLVAGDDSVTITNLLGAAASTGSLKITAQIPTSGDTATAGYSVFKGLSGDSGMSLDAGRVVEGVKVAGTLGATLTGGVAVNEADGDPVSGFKAGRLLLTINNPLAQLEGEMTVLALDGVDLASDYAVHYIKFRKNVLGSIRGSVRMPSTGVTDGSALSLEFWAMAKVTGTMPELELSVRKLAEPEDECDAVALDEDDDTYGPLDLTTCGSVTANSYVKSTVAAGTINPGDLVFFTLTRQPGDAYNGDVGILAVRWKITLA